MGLKLYNESVIQGIASAIRAKNGESTLYTVSEMVPAISALGGGAVDFWSVATKTITKINDSNITSTRIYAFAHCDNLSQATLSSCNIIGTDTFAYCSNLTTVNLPICTSIGTYAFYSCSSLTSVSIPNCSIINNLAFASCFSLPMVSLPACTSIGTAAFQNCSSLFSLYLMNSSVASLANSAVFSSTPMITSTGGVYGSIYVPSSLLASYKTATNWVTYSSRFVGI